MFIHTQYIPHLSLLHQEFVHAITTWNTILFMPFFGHQNVECRFLYRTIHISSVWHKNTYTWKEQPSREGLQEEEKEEKAWQEFLMQYPFHVHWMCSYLKATLDSLTCKEAHPSPISVSWLDQPQTLPRLCNKTGQTYSQNCRKVREDLTWSSWKRMLGSLKELKISSKSHFRSWWIVDVPVTSTWSKLLAFTNMETHETPSTGPWILRSMWCTSKTIWL